MYKLILVLSFLVFSHCADTIKKITTKPKLDGRIVGGYNINITDAPHQVSLQISGSHLCGGSIIGEKWIMTAAHCTNKRSAKDLTIRLGTSMFASGGEIIKVKQIVQHKKFDYGSIDFDYSLLELQQPIQFDDTKQLIKLPKLKEEIADDTLCTVSGWGNTQSNEESRSWLREAQVPIVNHQYCSKVYAKYGGITDRMVCAGYKEGGKDACQGDSGGPLVSDGVLYGVVSWGYGCAKPEYPGVYSKVSFVRDWINQNSGI